MSFELKLGDVLEVGSWHKRLVAHKMILFAWIDDNFKSNIVQDVVNFDGKRDIDSCGDYYHLVQRVREQNNFEISHNGSALALMTELSVYVMLKASAEKAVMAQIKRDRIEKLQKELKDLEAA